MKTSTRSEEPAKRPTAPERGAPATHAAQALRKNLSVRVLVKPTPNDSEELREHGYGHGV